MNALAARRKQDARDAALLEDKVKAMDSRISVHSMQSIQSIGKSMGSHGLFEKEFYQMSMRPTKISNQSRKEEIGRMEDKIDDQEREIRLLK